MKVVEELKQYCIFMVQYYNLLMIILTNLSLLIPLSNKKYERLEVLNLPSNLKFLVFSTKAC